MNRFFVEGNYASATAATALSLEFAVDHLWLPEWYCVFPDG